VTQQLPFKGFYKDFYGKNLHFGKNSSDTKNETFVRYLEFRPLDSTDASGGVSPSGLTTKV